MEYKIIEVHISQIRPGDTIMCDDGKIRTVNKDHIKYDPFIGYSLFGYTYNLGTVSVKKLLIGNGK